MRMFNFDFLNDFVVRNRAYQAIAKLPQYKLLEKVVNHAADRGQFGVNINQSDYPDLYSWLTREETMYALVGKGFEFYSGNALLDKKGADVIGLNNQVTKSAKVPAIAITWQPDIDEDEEDQ